MDLEAREVRRGGVPVDMSTKEFDVLAHLASSPREVFSRSDLLRDVWQSSPDWQDPATVTVHVRRIRNKIETDPAFLENFVRLDVRLSDDRTRLAHPIEPVKHGEKEQPWQVDGITGATISSVAIANLLDDSAGYWIPRIRRSLDDFRKAAHSSAHLLAALADARIR